MKKFLTAAAIALLCYAPVVDAAFYDDTSRYENVGKNMDYTTYLDNQLVESLRYDPPYYILKGRCVYIDYTKNGKIFRITFKIFYDMSQEKAKIQNISLEELSEDGTVLDETYIEEISKPSSISEGTNAFWVADYLFYKYYQENFFKDFYKRKFDFEMEHPGEVYRG